MRRDCVERDEEAAAAAAGKWTRVIGVARQTKRNCLTIFVRRRSSRQQSNCRATVAAARHTRAHFSGDCLSRSQVHLQRRATGKTNSPASGKIIGRLFACVIRFRFHNSDFRFQTSDFGHWLLCLPFACEKVGELQLSPFGQIFGAASAAKCRLFRVRCDTWPLVS